MAPSLRTQPTTVGKAWQWEVTLYRSWEEAGRGRTWCSASLHSVKTPTHEPVRPILRVGVPSSAKSCWKYPPGQSEVCCHSDSIAHR